VSTTTTPLLDIQALFDRYAATFAMHDADAVSRLHTADSVFLQRTGEPAVQGRDAVRDAFAQLFARWPDLGFDVRRVFTGERYWVLDWDLTATVNGREVRFACLDVVDVDGEGLVTRKETFVDQAQAQASLARATA
jgi:uncharacterized protein (TIGR02246 family)